MQRAEVPRNRSAAAALAAAATGGLQLQPGPGGHYVYARGNRRRLYAPATVRALVRAGLVVIEGGRVLQVAS